MAQAQRRIRVMQVIDSLHIGGAENAVVLLAQRTRSLAIRRRGPLHQRSGCAGRPAGRRVDRRRARRDADAGKASSATSRRGSSGERFGAGSPTSSTRTARRGCCTCGPARGDGLRAAVGAHLPLRQLSARQREGDDGGTSPVAMRRRSWSRLPTCSARRSIRYHHVSPDAIVTVINGVDPNRAVADPSCVKAAVASSGSPASTSSSAVSRC